MRLCPLRSVTRRLQQGQQQGARASAGPGTSPLSLRTRWPPPPPLSTTKQKPQLESRACPPPLKGHVVPSREKQWEASGLKNGSFDPILSSCHQTALSEDAEVPALPQPHCSVCNIHIRNHPKQPPAVARRTARDPAHQRPSHRSPSPPASAPCRRRSGMAGSRGLEAGLCRPRSDSTRDQGGTRLSHGVRPSEGAVSVCYYYVEDFCVNIRKSSWSALLLWCLGLRWPPGMCEDAFSPLHCFEESVGPVQTLCPCFTDRLEGRHLFLSSACWEVLIIRSLSCQRSAEISSFFLTQF